jgi:plastocyanin
MRIYLAALMLLLPAQPASAQSVLERSPNIAGTWTLAPGNAAFAFAHRFEVLSGGDELINFPTLTLAVGLPAGLTAGLDYTSNSEIVRERMSGNETAYWLKRSVSLGNGSAVAGLLGYSTAARSVDGVLSARTSWSRISAFGELRGFSDLFGTGDGGAATAVGALIRLTPYLGMTGDVGRVVSADSFAATWSAGVAVAIPGTPHSFSLHATNAGALTPQGFARKKVIGPQAVRYGFVFTVPLGTGSQWARIVAPGRETPPSPSVTDSIAVRIDLRQIAFAPREVRIRAGQSVEWLNGDPVVHTVTGRDGRWGSELLHEGQRFVQRFPIPGRYPYYCLPHPMMTGVVIVEG